MERHHQPGTDGQKLKQGVRDGWLVVTATNIPKDGPKESEAERQRHILGQRMIDIVDKGANQGRGVYKLT